MIQGTTWLQDKICSCNRIQCKWRADKNPIYVNAWFPFMYSKKWNCYFQNRIIMFFLPVPTLIDLREIYIYCIFPGSVCLFCCRKLCGPILGIYKSLTDTWMWKLGLRPHNYQKKEYINGIFVAVYKAQLISENLKILEISDKNNSLVTKNKVKNFS